MTYRIVEKEFRDGMVKYVVETDRTGTWTSIVTVATLPEAREVIVERQNKSVVNERVVE